MKMFLLLIMLSFTGNAFAFKVGVVDLEKVLTTLKEAKKIKKSLDQMLEQGKISLKEKEEELVKLNKTYEKQKVILSDDAKEKKQQEMISKSQELQMGQVQLEREILAEENKKLEPVMVKLQGIIETIAEKRNLDITVSLQANPFVTLKNKIDITNEVIMRYEKKTD